MAGVIVGAGFTSYTYDSVLEMFFAQARFYDAGNRMFTQSDPARDGFNLYVYCWGNPISYVDYNGHMPKKALNMLKDLHILGLIPEDSVGTIVILANLVSSATDFVGKVTEIVLDPVGGSFDLLRDVMRNLNLDEEIKDGNPSKQNIFLSFHETAQILAAKQIYLDHPELATFLQHYPVLELLVLLTMREMDIAYNDNVWEVKPGNASLSSFKKSLNKYVNDYSLTKKQEEYITSLLKPAVPGGSFADIKAKLFELNGLNINILVKYLGPGQVGYFFETGCGQKMTNAQVAEVLLPFFETATSINDITEIGLVLAGLLVLTAETGGAAAPAIGPVISELFSRLAVGF